MPKTLINTSPDFSFQKRKNLITQHAFFKSLKLQEILELALIAHDKKFSSGETIVSQGELVDSVYLIAEGDIEVSVQTETKSHHLSKQIPQAVLKPGESIGLGDTGFFAQNGIRTATLKAINPVLLIGWTMEDFHHFLQTHPSLGNSMQETAEQFTWMNFIRQVVPFADVTANRIAQLAKSIKKIEVPAPTVLFREGEVGEECYLIRSGKVEISVAHGETERTVAILESPMLFGEMALLTDLPRNATAKMLEDGNLLVLQKKQLKEFIGHHITAAESITILMIERSRPIQHANIKHFHRTTAEGEPVIILKNEKQGRYFQLSEVGWYIWKQLNGKQTIQDITFAVNEKHHLFIPDLIADTILELVNAGFISLPAVHFQSRIEAPRDESSWDTFKRFMLKIIYINFIFREIDKGITLSYHAGIFLLFSKLGQVLLFLITIIGLFVFVITTNSQLANITSIPHPILFIICIVLSNLFLVLFHELAHAYTTKASGHEVHRAGLIFYWVGLMAFVDTSDMWLSNRRARILVNLAGPYMDLILAGIFSLIAGLISQPQVSLFCWVIALVLYISVFRNLNPLHEGDGYYALSDTLGKPSLRLQSFAWLTTLNLTNLAGWHKHKNAIIYWLLCLLFLSIAISFALLLQYLLRLVLPDTLLGISTSHLTWVLPGLVIFSFITNVILSIKKLGLFSKTRSLENQA